MTISPSIGGLIAKGDENSIVVYGLWHFLIATSGTTVSVQLLGRDCGDFTVAADGTITVPLFGNTIIGGGAGGVDVVGVVPPQDMLDIDSTFDIEQGVPVQLSVGGVTHYINVPLVVGRVYVSQGQRLRAATADDIKSPSGAALGKYRRTHQFAVLVENAVVVKFGTSLTPTPSGNMIEAEDMLTQPGQEVDVSTGAGYSGVYKNTLVSDGGFDDMFCWQVDRPWPLDIMAINAFLKSEDRAEKP